MSELPKDLFKRIRRIQIVTRRRVEDLLAGAYHSVFKGQGIEFEDVRQYLPGDDVRSIDWKVTARTNQAHIKTFREERELTVMLLVDISASSRFGSGERSKGDWIAEIGALLAFSAISNNDKVGLILFSDRVEKYLPPKKGTRHVLRVIRELLVAEAKGTGTDIAQALTFLQKVQRRSGVCFVISDFMAPDYSREMTLAAKRFDLITIGIRDPNEYELPDLGLVHIRDLETGALRMVDTSQPELREQLKGRSTQRHEAHSVLMQRLGGGYIPIWTDEPYIGPIRKYFKHREHRRSGAGVVAASTRRSLP